MQARSRRNKGSGSYFLSIERSNSDQFFSNAANSPADLIGISNNDTMPKTAVDEKEVVIGWSQSNPGLEVSGLASRGMKQPSSNLSPHPSEVKSKKKRASQSAAPLQSSNNITPVTSQLNQVPYATAAASISYHGVSISQAAGQGSLPLCVLLWSLASSRRVNLMVPDGRGNNPMHFAALSDNPEIIGFLVQQTRGFFADNVRLVECRNGSGETPLLRAMSVGAIPVIRALLEESSDPFAIDHQGNSVFTLLAKNGHLWCLHFMFTFISKLQGPAVALELMSCVDNEGHSPLDWAADAGDVNMIEYLIRKGFNPYRVDSNNRSPLFWAVKAQRLPAVRFLLCCGCDPQEKDSKGQSCIKLARFLRFWEILAELRHFDKTRRRMACCRFAIAYPSATSVPKDDALGQLAAETRIQELYAANRNLVIIERPLESSGSSVDSGFADCMYWESTALKARRAHAIYRLKPSRFKHAFAYWFIVVTFWLLAICVPFFGWIPMVILSAFIFRYFERKASLARKTVGGDRAKLSILQDFLSCPEKGLGLWLGTMSAYVVFLFSSASAFYGDGDSPSSSEHKITENVRIRLQNPLAIGGLTAASDDTELFWLCSAWIIICLVLWMKLVWFDTDPGMIDSRFKDFDEVIDNSLETQGQPLPQHYCRTTLVRKPLRQTSKYCAHLGFVIARFDHYCIWLNNSIGFRNHLTFIIFLMSHLLTSLFAIALLLRVLYREAAGDSTCSVLSQVFGRRLFFVTVLCSIMIVVAIGLTMLFCEQLANILRNTTINERINGAKYSWMVDAGGNYCNRFDRSWILNTLEFLKFSKYKVDYFRVFEAPDHPPPLSLCSWWDVFCFCKKDRELDYNADGLHLDHQSDPEMNMSAAAIRQDSAPMPLSLPITNSHSPSRSLTPRHSDSSTDSTSNSSNGFAQPAAASIAALSVSSNSIMTPTSIQFLSNVGKNPHEGPQVLNSTMNLNQSSGSGVSDNNAVYGPRQRLRAPPRLHNTIPNISQNLDGEAPISAGHKFRSDSTDSSDSAIVGDRDFLQSDFLERRRGDM